jgi:hypothetical protein
MTAVAWTGLVNTTSAGTLLTKTAGCHGCADAGALSLQGISSADGYVELKTGAGLHFVGLSAGTAWQSAVNVPFGLRLKGQSVEVREYGQYRSDVLVSPTDTLRITVSGGKVIYSKNGVAFYTSAMAPPSLVRVHATLYEENASIVTPVILVQ